MTKRTRAVAAILSLIGVIVAALLLWPKKQPIGDQATPIDESRVTSGAHPSVLITEPLAMAALERRGYSLNRMMGAGGTSNADLRDSRAYADLVRVLDADVKELDRRPTIGDERAPNHGFKIAWLTDERARFELVGIAPRLDRAFVEASTCGEIRLIYRLVLEREGRPSTRLPMTLSVLLVPRAAPGACAELANAFASLPKEGAARVSAIAEILKKKNASPRRIEVNVQSLHGPSLRKDEDDHAEYLMRSFDVTPQGLAQRKLLDTPRPDLNADERAALAKWITTSFSEIDRGTAVVPDAFLATRVVSFAPRGLARKKNRPFAMLFGGDADKTFAALPFDQGKLVKSPRALVRRLDQQSCPGCHQSRAIAGFHLLGEEREETRTWNALAIGASNHLQGELAWRERFLAATVKGAEYTEPRPFADRPAPGDSPGGDGAWGARCSLGGDAAFAAFTCAAGLSCIDDIEDELGACTHATPTANGDACERAKNELGDGPDGDKIIPEKKRACGPAGANDAAAPPQSAFDACSPNAYGFPGGMCSEVCTDIGKVEGDTICADLPAAGYESDCFPTDVPIEECIKTHLARRKVRACDATHPCRDDFACARVENAKPGAGACVPPYFVFQARVDGPRKDR